MGTIKKFCEKYIDNFGLFIVVLTIFSSFFITGLFGMGNYGSIFNYALFIFFLLYIGMALINKRFRNISYRSIDFYVCLYLLCYFITIVFNASKIQNLKIFILTAIQWIILFHYTKTKRRIVEKILYVLNIIIFITTVIGIIYCFLMNHPVSNFSERYCGLYENPNTGAIICAISIAISMMFLQFKNIWNRTYLIVNIIFQLMMVRLCLSRAALIMLIVFLILFVVLMTFNYEKKGIAFVRNALFVGLSFVLVYNVMAPKLYRLRDLILYRPDAIVSILQPNNEHGSVISERNQEKETYSDGHRLNLLLAGSRAFFQNPIVGAGQMNLPQVVNEQMQLEDLETGGVHNAYLQMLISNGILGFISYASIYIAMLVVFIRKRKCILEKMLKTNDYSYFCGFTALILSLFLYGLLESVIVLSSSFPAVVMSIVAGGIASFVENKEIEKGDKK